MSHDYAKHVARTLALDAPRPKPLPIGALAKALQRLRAALDTMLASTYDWHHTHQQRTGDEGARQRAGVEGLETILMRCHVQATEALAALLHEDQDLQMEQSHVQRSEQRHRMHRLQDAARAQLEEQTKQSQMLRERDAREQRGP